MKKYRTDYTSSFSYRIRPSWETIFFLLFFFVLLPVVVDGPRLHRSKEAQIAPPENLLNGAYHLLLREWQLGPLVYGSAHRVHGEVQASSMYFLLDDDGCELENRRIIEETRGKKDED